MAISRVHIENFRSVKTLDFVPGRYAVLIGENNAGKSNVLKALNLALGEAWPTERSFSEEDFFVTIPSTTSSYRCSSMRYGTSGETITR